MRFHPRLVLVLDQAIQCVYVNANEEDSLFRTSPRQRCVDIVGSGKKENHVVGRPAIFVAVDALVGSDIHVATVYPTRNE